MGRRSVPRQLPSESEQGLSSRWGVVRQVAWNGWVQGGVRRPAAQTLQEGRCEARVGVPSLPGQAKVSADHGLPWRLSACVTWALGP